MEHSDNIDQIAGALSALAGVMQDVGKDVQGYGYRYAAIDSYLRIARPLMAKHGLALIQSPRTQPGAITLTSLLTHSSGQWIRSELTLAIEPKKGLSEAQCAGTVITYARRYALASLLGMAAEDDDAAKDREKRETADVKEFPAEREAIEMCESLDQLVETWKKLSLEARASLIGVKDAKKKALQA